MAQAAEQNESQRRTDRTPACPRSSRSRESGRELRTSLRQVLRARSCWQTQPEASTWYRERCVVTDTLNFKLLLERLHHPVHHVLNQAAGQSMQRSVASFVVRTRNDNVRASTVTCISGLTEKASSPAGPFADTFVPATSTFTPDGRATGFFPIRDITEFFPVEPCPSSITKPGRPTRRPHPAFELLGYSIRLSKSKELRSQYPAERPSCPIPSNNSTSRLEIRSIC